MTSSAPGLSSSQKPILKRSLSGSSLPRSSKKVWFDSVAINYHKIILGDNPAVSDGAPITIGWKAHEKEVIDVDCFEATRPKAERKASSLKLPVQDRAAILLDNGYSVKQLAKMIQQVEEIQHQRALSFEFSKWDRITALKESSGKIFRRLTRINSSSAMSTTSPTKPTNPAA